MAYADQQMSGNKITALIIVALLHVAVGYALVTGLAYSAFKKIKDVTTAVKIEEEKPKEPPPPPPKQPDHPPPPQQRLVSRWCDISTSSTPGMARNNSRGSSYTPLARPR